MYKKFESVDKIIKVIFFLWPNTRYAENILKKIFFMK